MNALPESRASDTLPSLAEIQALVGEDMQRVDALIRRALRSDVALINQVAEHIIAAGGKRLRPMLVLLSAGACSYCGDARLDAAAIIEFIHTATLLHDDVVDESELRRGRSTANAIWGNAASVLVGDFLYSRSFQMMVGIDRMAVMRILADTTNRIAEGEVLQLLHLGNPDTDEAAYLEVIRRKTAALFEAAAQLGAVLADAPQATAAALARYGLELGMAFQIADDLLDYTGDAERLGKNLGDDLAEGKATLPLLRLSQVGSEAQRELVRALRAGGARERLGEVLAALRDSDALPYTLRRAQQHADAAMAALEPLPASPWRDALAGLARCAVERDR